MNYVCEKCYSTARSQSQRKAVQHFSKFYSKGYMIYHYYINCVPPFQVMERFSLSSLVDSSSMTKASLAANNATFASVSTSGDAMRFNAVYSLTNSTPI
jgi:hypothetical protein